MSVTFSIAFTVLAIFKLKGDLTVDYPMATGAFKTFYTFICGGLGLIEVEVDRAKVLLERRWHQRFYQVNAHTK